MNCQPKCQKCEQNKLSNNITLDEKVICHWLCFSQVVQKQTLGEVENSMIV